MSRFVSCVFVLALAGASAARADEVVATSDRVEAPGAAADTATQIEDFIRHAPPPRLDDDAPNGVTSSTEPRKVHGEVGFAVGTGGYRSGYAISVMPVGKTGTLTLAVSDTRYGNTGRARGYYGGPRGFGGGERQSMGLSLALGEAAQEPCRVPGFRPHGFEERADLDRAACRERDEDR